LLRHRPAGPPGVRAAGRRGLLRPRRRGAARPAGFGRLAINEPGERRCLTPLSPEAGARGEKQAPLARIGRQPMEQLKKVVEPFGEVNVYPAAGGKVRVVATILMEPRKEGAQTGIALDGSGSMARLYGVDTGGGVVSSLFARKPVTNQVSPVARSICA